MSWLISCKPMLISLQMAGFLLAWDACCDQTVPVNALRVDELTWVDYKNPVAAYRLQYPTVFGVDQEAGGTVLFRYCGVPALVRFTDEAEGRRRGLWFGNEPVADITLAGHAGKKYLYTHYDGPFGVCTVAYVIPYRDKFIGVEFRTAGELGDVQERMLASFTLNQD